MRIIPNGIAALAVGAAVAIILTNAHDSTTPVEGSSRKPFVAVAFDSLVLFNPDSVMAAVEQVSPGDGREFINLWRTRQFEYSWLRSITNRYVDFSAVTEDALVYTANATKVELTVPQKHRLLDAYLHLTPWPDSAGALRRLRESGDKPDPRAYQLGVDRLQVDKGDIVFAAFAGWDAAGAKAFGYPTVWVNRFNQPLEELGVRPDRTVTDLNGLLDFVLNPARAQ